MNIRRLQGWALIISGLLGLLSMLQSNSPVVRVLLIVGGALLIVGVPAIEAVQRLGMLGVAGIILIELAAITALVVNVIGSGGAVMNSAIPFASALAGALGRVIVGWLTSRQKIFPAWAGWAFIVEGLLNLLGGIIEVPLLTPIVMVVLPLAGAVALLGYGMGILRAEGSQLAQVQPSAR